MSESAGSGEDREWRCVRTRPKSEHIAARHLRSMDGVEIVCPRIRHRKATARGQVWFIEALFPGYVFARCDWPSRQRAVMAATGVTGLVKFGEVIPKVPDAAVDDLRTAFGDEEVVTVTELVAEGDSVEVAAGPFQGATATVTRLLPGRERVAVLLDFLGSPREIEISLLSVIGMRDARQSTFSAPPDRG